MKICKDCINLIKKVKRIKGEKQTTTTFKCLLDGEKVNILDTEVVECNQYDNEDLVDVLKSI